MIRWETILDFMKTRQGLLDAIVFSGGEPLLQNSLLTCVLQMKDLGFFVALHTAGACPERLEQVLPYLDWVCLDLKASVVEHHKVTNIPTSGMSAYNSLEILKQSGVEHTIKFGIY
jgi:pyruvate formate lyase activating enzyme